MESLPRVKKYRYRYKEIDNDLLIHEVKIRPALYDRNTKEYNDPSSRNKFWEQIFLKMFQSVWHTFDESEREMRGLEVIKRWNNLRACFSRDLKAQSNPTRAKRRKYIYFNKLLFLLDHSKSQHASLYDSEQDSNQESEEPDPLVEVKIKKHTLKSRDEKRQKKIEDYVDYSINKLKAELSTSLSALSSLNIEADSDMPSSSKPIDACPDSNFALSLVPSLKMIPEELKIDAQIEILNILKKYVRKDSVDVTVVKYEQDDGSLTDNSISSNMLDLYESND